MAFPGLIGTDFLFFPNPDDVTDGIVRTDPSNFHQTFDDLFLGATGSHTENIPDVGRLAASGCVQTTFVDDFYNRVHFLPSSVAYGAIAQIIERTVRVWNAHLVSNTLDVLTIDPAIGVSYSTGATVPFAFGALEEVEMGFTADVAGPPDFSSFVTFDFSLKDPYLLLFTGDRSVLLEGGPNWRDVMTETYSFKTEIVSRSRSGIEQRRALRQEPRRTFSYTLSVWEATRRSLMGLLTRWRRRTVLAPMWPYRTSTTAITAAATSVLTVDLVPSWALPLTNVLIQHKGLINDMTGLISSTGAGTITLVSPVAVEVPAGATVFQMLTGRLADNQVVNRFTAEVGEAPLTYDLTPGVDPTYTPPASPLDFNGYEVFLIDPNWASSLDERWDMPLDVTDAGWGKKDFFEFQDFVQYAQTMVFSGDRDGKIQDIIDLFYRQRGKLGEFWMSTYGVDVVPGYQLDESSTVVRIVGTDFSKDWDGQTTNAAVVVRLVDGTVLLREVTGVSTTTDAFGTDSVIDLADVWPYDIPLNQIIKFSWLMRVRFGTDTLQLEWLTDGQANAQFSILTQEAL